MIRPSGTEPVLRTYAEASAQEKVFDIAFQYAGMGHIVVLSCDLDNHLLFKRRDGGSNDYDREVNYKNLLNYKAANYKHMYFTQWKDSLTNS